VEKTDEIILIIHSGKLDLFTQVLDLVKTWCEENGYEPSTISNGEYGYEIRARQKE